MRALTFSESAEEWCDDSQKQMVNPMSIYSHESLSSACGAYCKSCTAHVIQISRKGCFLNQSNWSKTNWLRRVVNSWKSSQKLQGQWKALDAAVKSIRCIRSWISFSALGKSDSPFDLVPCSGLCILAIVTSSTLSCPVQFRKRHQERKLGVHMRYRATFEIIHGLFKSGWPGMHFWAGSFQPYFFGPRAEQSRLFETTGLLSPGDITPPRNRVVDICAVCIESKVCDTKQYNRRDAFTGPIYARWTQLLKQNRDLQNALQTTSWSMLKLITSMIYWFTGHTFETERKCQTTLQFSYFECTDWQSITTPVDVAGEAFRQGLRKVLVIIALPMSTKTIRDTYLR